MSKFLERRFTSLGVRAISDVGNGAIVGYAAKFSWGGQGHQNWSSDLGGFRERCSPNCFARSLARGDDVFCLWNHDPAFPLGRVSTGNLRLNEDRLGLHMRCDLPDTTYAKDLFETIRAGITTDQSFAFECDEDSWSAEPDPDNLGSTVRLRTLIRCTLRDVSPCTYGAYPAANIQAADAPVTSDRSRFESLFPDGLPYEIRMKVPDAKERFTYNREMGDRDAQRRRRELTSRILSL